MHSHYSKLSVACIRMCWKCVPQEIDYFLPGVKPTGKPLELAVVGIVAFRGDKLTFEYVILLHETIVCH